MLIGYAHVSTEEQKLDLQREALRDAGSERIFEDAAGGAAERPAPPCARRWPSFARATRWWCGASTACAGHSRT